MICDARGGKSRDQLHIATVRRRIGALQRARQTGLNRDAIPTGLALCTRPTSFMEGTVFAMMFQVKSSLTVKDLEESGGYWGITAPDSTLQVVRKGTLHAQLR